MRTLAALSVTALLTLSGAAYAQHTTGTGQPLKPGANGTETVPSSGTQMNGTGQPDGQSNSGATNNLNEGRASSDMNAAPQDPVSHAPANAPSNNSAK